MRQSTRVRRADSRPGESRSDLPLAAVAGDDADGADAIENDLVARWADEQLDRRAGDASLFAELIKANCEGRTWERFTDALVIYAVAVMRVWISNGRIRIECGREGWIIPTEPEPEQDDVESLAHDVVLRALTKFHTDLRDGTGWRSDGGASLKTYFIKGCTYEYPNFYRSWQRRQGKRNLEQTTAEPDEDRVLGQTCRIPEEEVTEADTLREWQVHFLRGLALEERELLLYQLQGYEPSVIAELVGADSNPYDVKRRLLNLRKKVRRRHTSCPVCLGARMRSAS